MGFFNFYPLRLGINSSTKQFLFIAAALVVLLLFVSFLIKLINKSKHESRTNSKKPTNLSNINKITNIYNLTSEQKNFIINLCKTQKIPNLEVNLHSENFCNNFFMTQYYILRKNEKNLSESEVENQISILFAIRQKIENGKKNLSNLTTSIAIPENQILILYNNKKEQYQCKILKNTKENLIVSIPKSILSQEYKPETLSKITLFYQTENGSAYIIDSRVIRYQNGIENEEMILSHSNQLKCFQRRKFKRIDINTNCEFSAVKTTTQNKGGQTFVNYEPLERKYSGKLLEISAGGCSISTNLHIREKQYSYIEFNLSENHSDSVIGLIVNSEEGYLGDSYILHIVFVNINKKTRNRIFSKVYDYLY